MHIQFSINLMDWSNATGGGLSFSVLDLLDFCIAWGVLVFELSSLPVYWALYLCNNTFYLPIKKKTSFFHNNGMEGEVVDLSG